MYRKTGKNESIPEVPGQDDFTQMALPGIAESNQPTDNSPGLAICFIFSGSIRHTCQKRHHNQAWTLRSLNRYKFCHTSARHVATDEP
ncbi:hypothetical protein RRG08_041404 [Elysia crispata]|uniref:Uncharacterized protein n=1 Tax=Elysia crispata TaxID=231223 RepID=A0AAE0XRE3_9GAST|nr:hypothetical protein RRG08_041404 [Elysia crispata]